jgi:serine/threonine-protein kinase
LSNEIKIGELVDQRFEITDLIERSGMASVFKAVDLQTSQTVVLKVPHTGLGGSAATASRFAREAAIISKLDHPGILKIIPVAEKSHLYIVMEYLEGRTLYDILEQTRVLPVNDAIRLASRLCDILEYVHRHGIVHRDLKPGNIMISDDGTPHIIDFGIARAPGAEAFSSKVGTPEYMAPEQILGDKIDARTDLYSLGAVLYEVVTGTRPFQNDASGDPLDSRLAVMPCPPRKLNPNLTEQVEEIILHAMAPNPRDRYRSAVAMKLDLDSPEKVQVTRLYRTPRKASAWAKRLRLTGLILGAGAAPFILFYLFFLIFQRQLAR